MMPPRTCAAAALALLAATLLAGGGGALAPSSATAPSPSPSSSSSSSSGPPHFAWMGSGLLFPFYSGVADALIEGGALVPGHTTHGAMSGGALATLATAAGAPGAATLDAYTHATWFCEGAHVMDRPALDLSSPEGATQAAKELEDCRTPESGWFWPRRTLDGMLRQALAARNTSLAPSGGDLVALLSRTLQIWAAELDATNSTALDEDLPAVLQSARSKPLAPYTSLDDAVGSALTSSHLPCLLDSNYYTAFRGQPMVDGGYAASWPQLCALPGSGEAAPRCVRVAATWLGPDGLVPPGVAQGDKCDTKSAGGLGAPLQGPGWARQPGIPPNPGTSPPNETGWGPPYPPVPEDQWGLKPKSCGDTLGGVLLAVALDTADANMTASWPPDVAPDINPGKRTRLPLAPCEWRSFIKVPPNRTVSETMYQHGLDEGRAWINEEWGG